MREVDELQQSVDHAVAECDQRINRPKGNTIDQLLEKLVHSHLDNQDIVLEEQNSLRANKNAFRFPGRRLKSVNQDY